MVRLEASFSKNSYLCLQISLSLRHRHRSFFVLWSVVKIDAYNSSVWREQVWMEWGASSETSITLLLSSHLERGGRKTVRARGWDKPKQNNVCLLSQDHSITQADSIITHHRTTSPHKLSASSHTTRPLHHKLLASSHITGPLHHKTHNNAGCLHKTYTR